MITRCQITFSIRGTGFNPAGHDLPWTTCDLYIDPENWCTGAVHYDVAGLAEQEKAIQFLHQTFLHELPALRRSGATEVDLFITWTHDGQCSGSFSERELKWMAELGCSLALDTQG